MISKTILKIQGSSRASTKYFLRTQVDFCQFFCTKKNENTSFEVNISFNKLKTQNRWQFILQRSHLVLALIQFKFLFPAL